jgi:hypothetical protein
VGADKVSAVFSKLFFMREAVLVEIDRFESKHIFVVCLPQMPLVFVIEPNMFSH